MMIYNSINNQRENVIKAPHLGSAEEGKASKGNHAANNSPAATFNHLKKGDYQGKKLSPLQESILNLQEQMQKVKSNEKIGSETKDELLKTMDQQLKELEKQLSEENVKANEEDSASSIKKKTNNHKDAMGNGESAKGQEETSSLIAAGVNLEQVKSAGVMTEKNAGKAKLAQHELDDAVEKGRLSDEDIISKRQGEIDDIESIGEKLHNTLDEVKEKQEENVEQYEKTDEHDAESAESNKKG